MAAQDGSGELLVGDGGEDLDEHEETGTRRTIKMTDPCRPNNEEVQEHEKTHLPYRNWCRHCVSGRGREMAHKKSSGTHELPELHFDFCFLGREGEPHQTLSVLVVREGLTKMTMSSAVPSKSTGTFIAKRVVSFMREIGLEHVDVIAKSDQEPAINALLLEVGRVRAANSSGRYIVEQSPVGSSQSNGIAERAILSVQQQVRVLKCALETRWKVDIHSKHPVMPWLIEYASYLLNRFEVG
jgi:hypothetical protein